ncbi:MAG TPA: hypothetical protein VMB74_11965 [Streptosporangiaceae bacterium]|nr:hypothetical protein [Streptosporangiaceae bacterium]
MAPAGSTREVVVHNLVAAAAEFIDNPLDAERVKLTGGPPSHWPVTLTAGSTVDVLPCQPGY